ncbi:MAG: 3-methyladenine DNA glycosylase [Bacteroidetes bacterium]|nr:MAG: 3-methyladenine DNA glycosylase [Bacteroidota bacterium]
MVKLGKDFYLQGEVVSIAKQLLGKALCTKFNGVLTAGIITETEAYAGTTDKASHAYFGRRTKRTEVMFAEGGVAYIYLCYGIHHLFNIVTNQKDIPHAILIRAIQPKEGIDLILKRRNKKTLDKAISAGPGTVSQALGIKTTQTGTSLLGSKIWLQDLGIKIPEKDITVGPRIGVDYAKEDSLLPYRFVAAL